MKELAALLGAVSEEGSENTLTVQDVKNWLPSYLESHQEETEQFSGERNKPHWDTIVADYDSNKDATFIVVIFDRDSVTFIALKTRTMYLMSFPAVSQLRKRWL